MGSKWAEVPLSVGLGGKQGGSALSPQLGEVMLRAWEGLGGVVGSAPPSPAGEQKDGTWGGASRALFMSKIRA